MFTNLENYLDLLNIQKLILGNFPLCMSFHGYRINSIKYYIIQDQLWLNVIKKFIILFIMNTQNN